MANYDSDMDLDAPSTPAHDLDASDDDSGDDYVDTELAGLFRKEYKQAQERVVKGGQQAQEKVVEKAEFQGSGLRPTRRKAKVSINYKEKNEEEIPFRSATPPPLKVRALEADFLCCMHTHS